MLLLCHYSFHCFARGVSLEQNRGDGPHVPGPASCSHFQVGRKQQTNRHGVRNLLWVDCMCRKYALRLCAQHKMSVSDTSHLQLGKMHHVSVMKLELLCCAHKYNKTSRFGNAHEDLFAVCRCKDVIKLGRWNSGNSWKQETNFSSCLVKSPNLPTCHSVFLLGQTMK